MFGLRDLEGRGKEGRVGLRMDMKRRREGYREVRNTSATFLDSNMEGKGNRVLK